jgi:hypothetical protein
MTAVEEWRLVVGYEGWYEVSDHGRVRRVKAGRGARFGKVLAMSYHNHGYLNVSLCRDGIAQSFLVHRLVAEAFLGPCLEGLMVNHKDGVKTNNRPDNLEYCTCAENIAHAVDTGLFACNFKAGRQSSPLIASQVADIRRLYPTKTQDELAEQFGVAQTTISCIVRRKRWKEIA